MKLTKNVSLSFMSAALTMAMLTSCSSNEEPQSASSAKGEPTYAAFSISLVNSFTRSADENADPTGAEEKISKVNVFIFSNGVLESAVRGATMTASGSNVTMPIVTTTGEKVIYVVTNDIYEGETALSFSPEATLLTNFEKTLFNSASSKIASENNFTMIGCAKTVVVKCTEEQAKANPVKVSVDRASVKVQVKYGSSVNVRPTLAADFSDASFTLCNQARHMYVKSDNLFSTAGSLVSGAYSDVAGLAEAPAYLPAVAVYDNSFATNLYTAENKMENPVSGNALLSVIKIKCSPIAFYGNASANANGDFWTVARHDAATASWIYASDDEYNVLYFATESDATAYQAAIGGDYEVAKFNGGYSYYRVYLKDDAASENLSEKYRALRNTCYRINITDIKALGAPTGDDVIPEDPDTPIEQDSWVASEISVSPWSVTEQDAELQ